jgi:hypothetical protein
MTALRLNWSASRAKSSLDGLLRWTDTAYVDRLLVYRGLAREFCIPETDLPQREILTDGPMFGTPVYRWLPAKAKIESHFLLFYASCL